MDNPDFWEWVKNKIREREQQPLQIEIQLPIPTLPPSNIPTNESDGIYENVDHEIKSDIMQL